MSTLALVTNKAIQVAYTPQQGGGFWWTACWLKDWACEWVPRNSRALYLWAVMHPGSKIGSTLFVVPMSGSIYGQNIRRVKRRNQNRALSVYLTTTYPLISESIREAVLGLFASVRNPLRSWMQDKYFSEQALKSKLCAESKRDYHYNMELETRIRSIYEGSKIEGGFPQTWMANKPI